MKGLLLDIEAAVKYKEIHITLINRKNVKMWYTSPSLSLSLPFCAKKKCISVSMWVRYIQQ